MRAFALHPATLAATCLLVLSGCGGVTFESPLSDDETTRFDERLVGYWEPLPSSMDKAEPAPGELWHHLVVGRLAEGSDRMEAVVLDVDSGVVKVTRIELHPTRIGDHRYLSLINREEEKKGYFVVRYHLPAEDRLQLLFLDEDVFTKAVERGVLKGVLPKSEEGAENRSSHPHITATTAELRAWMEAHADTCVVPKRLEFRRLVEKPSSEEVESPEPPPEGGSDGAEEEHDAEDEE